MAPTSSYKQQEPHGRPSVIFGNFWYLFYPVAKSRSRYPTFLYSDLRSIHMVGSYGHFNFGQKFILCQKKKKSSAHSFSPFASMIDPSKENWGSAVYFLFLCEKLPKITELQQVKGKKNTNWLCGGHFWPKTR